MSPGDTVYLESGDTYTDQAQVGKSGTAGNHIVISVNGTGTATIDLSGASSTATGIDPAGYSYITVDGVRGNAYAGDTTYGLRIIQALNGNCVRGASTEHDIKVFHVECATTLEGTGGDDRGGIRFQAGAGLGGNYEIAYNWIHGDVGTTHWYGSGITIWSTDVSSTEWDDTKIYQNRVEWLHHDGIKSNRNVSMYENYVSHIEGSGHSDSIQCTGGMYCQIYSNTVENSGDQNLYVNNISTSVGGPTRVYNNVTANGSFGLVIQAQTGSGGIDSVVVANNTFYHMTSATIRRGGGDAQITNAVFLNNYFGRADAEGYGVQVDLSNGGINFMDENSWDYNVYASASNYYPTLALYGGYQTLAQLRALSPARETNGAVADPAFVNSSIGDFRIDSADSALRGNGANLTEAYPWLTTDRAGIVRPASGAWDIGAYQYTPTSRNTVTMTGAGKLQ